jgi:alpha-beta hydrolase superfamily lysophospholipase
MDPRRPQSRPAGRRRRPTRGTHRRRRLIALLAAVVLAVVAVTVAEGSGSSGGGRLPRPVGSTTTAVRTAATATSRTATSPQARSGTATQSGSGGQRAAQPGTGAYRVGIASLSLSEPATAPTATGHTASGAPIRPLPTMIRYPATGTPDAGAHPGAAPDSAAGPFPLVVFSQGFDVSAESYSWLLDAWARAGFVVADPTYPLTDPSTPGGVSEADIVNHPGDLRFVISTLLAAGRDRHSVLHGLVDPGRAAIIGHSDGGDVSLAAAANSCCRIPQVKAAVILSGAELSAFGGSYYGAGSVPLLVVQGSADTINIPGCSAQLYDRAPQPKYYLNIAGAEHQPPYLNPGATRTGVARSVIAFLDAFMYHRPAHLRTLVRHGTVTGGENLTTAPALPPTTSTECPGAP